MVVVGAGITGLHMVHELRGTSVKACVLERNSRADGIWVTLASDRSHMHSSEATDRLLDKTAANDDHSTTREILKDAPLGVASGLGRPWFLQGQSADPRYRLQQANCGTLIRRRGLVIAINDRVGAPCASPRHRLS